MTMLEAARIIGCLSAFLLITAIAAWVKLSRSPALQPIDGSASQNGRIEIASQILVLAVGLSAVAAVLAIAAWIVT